MSKNMRHNTGSTASARRTWLCPLVVAAVVVILDQAAKAWVWRTMGPVEGASMPLLGSWLRLTLVYNTGVAFGLFQNIPYLFTILPVVISAGALYFYAYHLPHDRPLIQVCVGMIVGGAIGNIIDRLRLGFVIDFIHVTWFPGIFNVADSGITVGVIALAVYLLIAGDDIAADKDAPNDNALLSDLLGHDQ
jgi:signal peptidase II